MSNNGKTNVPLNQLIGSSEAMKEVKKMIKLVAPTDAKVLISGETGTGKTMIANIIHSLHPTRKNHNFRRTNIGALVSTLAQSQLYGHVAHAFTGATQKSDGIVLESNNGTFFLDEVATAHPEVQIMLLNLLEIPVVNPVGGGVNDRKKVDIRVISATTHSPHELLNRESFRTELFFRISEYIIELKPLRERKEDIKLLANHFMKANNEKIRCPGKLMEDGKTSKPFPKLKGIESKALKMLEDYDWPGNVRELEHVIRSAMVESRKDYSTTTLKKEWIKFSSYTLEQANNSENKAGVAFPGNLGNKLLFSWDINCVKVSNGDKEIELKQHVDRFRSGICNHVLYENNNNQAQSARILGIDTGSLSKYRQFDAIKKFKHKPDDGDSICRVYVVKN